MLVYSVTFSRNTWGDGQEETEVKAMNEPFREFSGGMTQTVTMRKGKNRRKGWRKERAMSGSTGKIKDIGRKGTAWGGSRG